MSGQFDYASPGIPEKQLNCPLATDLRGKQAFQNADFPIEQHLIATYNREDMIDFTLLSFHGIGDLMRRFGILILIAVPSLN
jgi:hypothetical protein